MYVYMCLYAYVYVSTHMYVYMYVYIHTKNIFLKLLPFIKEYAKKEITSYYLILVPVLFPFSQ